MDWLVVCLVAAWMVGAGSVLRRAIRHRRAAREHGRYVGTLWFHANQQYRELRDRGHQTTQVPEEAGRLTNAQTGDNTFSFVYCKPDGTQKPRTVRVERHGFDGSGKYVEGHCSDAHASRSFRLDRVQGVVTVMATGELISAAEMYRRLGASSRSLEVTSFSAAAKAAAHARRPGWQTAVYFAGFGANQYGELAELAEAAGMDVRASISRTVDYVVTGNLAGRQQIAQAEAHGVAVVDEATFRGML